jgi:Mrp family chromosome partitioning ATPase
MLERARLLADFVIVDSPPLTDVVDALPLARNVDDVLIVVRPGTTRLSKLTQLGELLAENGIRPMGFAVVGTKPPGRGESTYYFDHREFMPERSRANGGGEPNTRS